MNSKNNIKNKKDKNMESGTLKVECKYENAEELNNFIEYLNNFDKYLEEKKSIKDVSKPIRAFKNIKEVIEAVKKDSFREIKTRCRITERGKNIDTEVTDFMIMFLFMDNRTKNWRNKILDAFIPRKKVKKTFENKLRRYLIFNDNTINWAIVIELYVSLNINLINHITSLIKKEGIDNTKKLFEEIVKEIKASEASEKKVLKFLKNIKR